MEDFWRPIIQDEYFVVRQPAIEANNFELKPALIKKVQQYQFTGHPSEDPNKHMGCFMRMGNIVKLNGVRPQVIKTAENMAHAWNRSDHSYGYFLSCYELYLQGYN